MEEAGFDIVFVQDNQSMSVKGVLRGLHFQKHYPEHNLVRARAQLALFKDMMVHMGDMQNIVRELAE